VGANAPTTNSLGSIIFAGFIAACLVSVPFLIAFECVRNIVRRRKVAV
jgi:hypothetical protein